MDWLILVFVSLVVIVARQALLSLGTQRSADEHLNMSRYIS